jgi:hypothetical protein
MVVIFIAIHPVELQPLRDFGSEADFAPPQKRGTTFLSQNDNNNKKESQNAIIFELVNYSATTEIFRDDIGMELSRIKAFAREHPKATLVALATGAFAIVALRRRTKRSLTDQDEGGPATSSVVVLGDIFVDLIVQTDTLPAWGGDVVTAAPISALAGGSGLNTATHLSSSFEVPTSLWSAIGGSKHDAWGALVRDHARRAGFQLRGALDCAATGVCVVLTGAHDRSFVTHRGPIGDLHLINFDGGFGWSGREPGIDVDALFANLAPGGHLHIAG